MAKKYEGKKEYKANVIFTYPSRLLAEISVRGDGKSFGYAHIQIEVQRFLPKPSKPYKFDFDNARDLGSSPAFALQLENGEVRSALSALESSAQDVLSQIIRNGRYPVKRSISFGDIIPSEDSNKRICPKTHDARIPQKNRKNHGHRTSYY